ncbi:MAG: hypothetical protein CVT47_01930, partial [Thermoplasmata archaeon HGW-Thermoplasmata-2]
LKNDIENGKIATRRLEEGINSIKESNPSLRSQKQSLEKEADALQKECEKLQKEIKELKKEHGRLSGIFGRFGKSEKEQGIEGASKIEGTSKEEIVCVLRSLDELLGALPEEKVKEFSEKEEGKKYMELLEKLGI